MFDDISDVTSQKQEMLAHLKMWDKRKKLSLKKLNGQDSWRLGGGNAIPAAFSCPNLGRGCCSPKENGKKYKKKYSILMETRMQSNIMKGLLEVLECYIRTQIHKDKHTMLYEWQKLIQFST